ncbi:MAG TPA: SPFH domain-containing protein [Candidatus Babeliales bacterium]|nr:SPFH domain-containing protein [Candidatus Babeliales bacterium]
MFNLFDFPVYLLVFGILLIALVILVFRMTLLVRQAESIVIERLGRFGRILEPGIHLIIPFIERPRSVVWTYIIPHEEGKRYRRHTRIFSRIDLRESVYDFPKQNVITKDNVTMEINALLYYQITDPRAAVYEIDNLPEAIEKLTQTTLRDVIGSMDLDESLVSRDQINERLRIKLDEATDKWGVKVNRVELQEVNPPADIRHAMEKQMRAERDRRALILEAEGKKRATILEAEGFQQSKVLHAQGEAEAQVLRAHAEAQARIKVMEAEAKSIELIQKSLPNIDPQAYLVAMSYIKALPEITKDKDGKMIIVPYEASSLIGSLSMIKGLFEKTDGSSKSEK